MNATESIRGINYRLCKAPPPLPPPDYPQQHSPHGGITPPPLAVQSIYVSQMFPFYMSSFSPFPCLPPYPNIHVLFCTLFSSLVCS